MLEDKSSLGLSDSLILRVSFSLLSCVADFLKFKVSGSNITNNINSITIKILANKPAAE
jgi:hypothetical protein